MADPTSKLFALSSPAMFLFELLAGSAVVGLAPPRSLLRATTLPVLSSCVYGIVTTAGDHVRPRWASLLGGTAFAFLLQYVDIALVGQWNFRDQGPEHKSKTHAKVPQNPSQKDTFWNRLAFGWNSMWAFRRVNSSNEVKNVPPFSTSDPSYVPSKWLFVAQRLAITAVAYLILDLMTLRKPPTDLRAFDPALIPMISRITEVTGAEIKRKTLMLAGFAVTFYCLIQCAQSAAAAVAVAFGASKVESWRPAFGSPSDAYSLKNVWGKFWHQLLRKPLTGPSSAFTHNILGLQHGSIPAGYLTIFLSFTLSAILHTAAGLSSGAPITELGAFRFFWTQAFGLAIEEGIRALFARVYGGEEEVGEKTRVLLKGVGYVWVAAFLLWSGPAWLYPQVHRPVRPGSTSFLPFSVVRWAMSKQ